jgi:integrase/recombinase XerD
MNVTTNVFLDTRRIKKKSNAYPVKLRVTCNRKHQEYQTVFDLTSEDYKKLGASRVSDWLRDIKDKLREIESTASKVAKDLDPFTYEDFEKDYILDNPFFHQRNAIKASAVPVTNQFKIEEYGNRFPILKLPEPEPNTVLATTLYYIRKLLAEQRIRTAASYQTTYMTFSRFRGNVRFTQIDVAFLKQFEDWMLKQDYSKTTVGIYTRTLRTLFNEAIFLGIIKRDKCYPFGRRKYQPPASRNIKKALTLEDVGKIYYYEPVCLEERKAKDFWLFSYFANGINPTDIAHLKYKNIDGEYITFERAKTENATRSAPKPITVFITEDMQQIIDFWSTKDKRPGNYIFPVLQHDITPLRQVELIELFVQALNDWMRKIRKKLGIEKAVTTYVARHTFSTIMKRSGVSTEFIQESLGHTSIKTTENYLDSFEKTVKKEYSQKLVAFKKDAFGDDQVHGQ